MPLHITGRHMTLSEEQKDYINKKVDRLRRLTTKIDELQFTLTKEKLFFQADGNFRAGRLSTTATVQASQPLEAIDMLVDKLEYTLARMKARRNDRSEASRSKHKANTDNLKITAEEEAKALEA